MPVERDTSASSEKKPTTDGKDQLRGWYSLAGIGFEFIAAVLFCGGIGWWLDRTLVTSPWLTIVGSGLGFAIGLWLMVKAANRAFKK